MSERAVHYDVAVIGGGPAGMAAAVAASRCGAGRVLLAERNDFLGGVLPQCVHDGFGLHLWGESLTGPEYAWRWAESVRELPIDVVLGTTVTAIESASNDAGGALVRLVGVAVGGVASASCSAVVLASGSRERTLGQLRVPGTRPAGVFTAGAAQYMLNIKNYASGDKVVILGCGDVGLIMARRLTLEGADVRLVVGQEATGLRRNHVQCLEEFGVPVRYGWTVTSVHGYGRLKGVTVAPLGTDGEPDLDRAEYVRCNTLLVAAGLLPERELLTPNLACAVLTCGNVNATHDLVDAVTADGVRAGIEAAAIAARVAGRAFAETPSDLRAIASLEVAEALGARLSEAAPATGVCAAQLLEATCTLCPTGCQLVVRGRAEAPDVRGAGCERGEAYAREELLDPRRVVTTTVRIGGWSRPLLPVRTDAAVPRSAIAEVMRATRRVRLSAPVAIGSVVIADVAGTGVDLIATDDASVKTSTASVATASEVIA